MHFYPFNIGDYAKNTQHLEPLEDLAYRRMLDLYYSKESPLPESIADISRLIRMRSHTDCIAVVLQDFFTLKDGFYHCKKADEEIAKYQAKSDKARKSAQSRWKNKQNECERIANAEQTQCEPNADAMLNKKQETRNITNTNLKDIKPATQSSKKSAKQEINFDVWQQKPDPQILKDFIAHRKTKKAPITQLVFDRIGKEINLAAQHGYSVDDCLMESMSRGWIAFKCQWMLNSDNKKGNQGNANQIQEYGIHAQQTMANCEDFINGR